MAVVEIHGKKVHIDDDNHSHHHAVKFLTKYKEIIRLLLGRKKNISHICHN